MSNLRSRGSLRALVVVVLFVGGTIACAETMSAGIDDKSNDAGASATSFAPTDAGADAVLVQPPAQCIATECPYPYATCQLPSAITLLSKCETNLLSDPVHCGACGKACPTDLGPLHLSTKCLGGVCRPACESGRMDCNGILDDGCEVRTNDDPSNCGTCGNKCAAGVKCYGGKCGCPSGTTECDGVCVNTLISFAHCGGCNQACYPEAGAPDPPPQMDYGCAGGTCGLGCWQNWANCNNDLANGCEVDLRLETSCGSCGNVCPAGKICMDENGDGTFECACSGSQTLCGGVYTAPWCADLLNDVKHCGGCSHACQPPGEYRPHSIAACTKGLCTTSCEQGWADCDGDLNNGCEANLLVNGLHCGACGNACDVAAGQPCIGGKCLAVDCDGGSPQ